MCISNSLRRRYLGQAESLLNKQLVEKAKSQNDGRHHVVKHDYHDHAKDNDADIPEPVARGGVTTPFPLKLHEMLDRIERDGFASVISWQPHGRCIVVHQPKEFVQHVMPTYFGQTKFASFQRQLNLYGFNRITQGPDKGGYYHELFLRGKPNLSHKIHRMKVKGTGVRARSNPETEPNFYNMAPIGGQDSDDNSSATTAAETVSSLETVVPSCATSVLRFEGMPFHYLDPPVNYVDALAHNQPMIMDDEDNLSGDEMDSFLTTLNISRNLYRDILSTVEDDANFGVLLERVIE